MRNPAQVRREPRRSPVSRPGRNGERARDRRDAADVVLERAPTIVNMMLRPGPSSFGPCTRTPLRAAYRCMEMTVGSLVILSITEAKAKV